MNTEELVAMYEDNRKGRLNEVVHEYLHDSASTPEIFFEDLKSIFTGHANHKIEEARLAEEAALAKSEEAARIAAELADKVEEQNAAQNAAADAQQYASFHDDVVVAYAGTAFDAPQYYATPESYNIDSSIYPPDHPYHIDTSISVGSTAGYPTTTYTVDTTTYGDVSIASSEANPTGYYDHDLAGPYYVDGHSDVHQVPTGIASSEANPTGYYDEPNNVDPQTPETVPVPEPEFDPLAVPSKFDNHR